MDTEFEEQPPQEEVFSGPLKERLVHKNFKARKAAYEELQGLCATGEELSEEYVELFKKIISDTNAFALEAALEFFVVYFDKVDSASKHASQVAPGVVEKCLGANKSSTAKKAQDLVQLMFEVGSTEIVLCELLKGYRHKSPKVRLAAVQCTTEALKNFGVGIPIKEILKKEGLLAIFNDQDGKVRKEALSLTVLIYQYLKEGPGLRSLPFFSELRDAQKVELEKLFTEVQCEPVPQPLRGFRSEVKSVGLPATGKGQQPSAKGSQGIDLSIDDLIEAKPVLSKLPKSFFDVVGGSGKWTERKEMLEVLANLVNGHKPQNDEYLQVVKLLKKLLNDTNVPLVVLAIKILGYFAVGLRSGFATYTRFYFPTLLEKFKEKKVTVLEPLNATMELLHQHHCVSLADCSDDIVSAATNKVPQVREHTLLWLGRCLARSDRATFQRAFGSLSTTVVKCCDDSNGAVRDAGLRILARASISLGESSIASYLPKMDKKQQDKIRNHVRELEAKNPEDVANHCKTETPRSARCDSINLKRVVSPSQTSEDGAPPLKRAASGDGGMMRSTKAPGLARSNSRAKKDEDFELGGPTDTQVHDCVSRLLPEGVLVNLRSSAFKERLEALDQVLNAVESFSENEVNEHAEVLIRLLKGAPGWKEANFQVLNKIFQVVEAVATRASTFSKRCVWLCLPVVIDKVADFKQKALCRKCLLVFSEAVGPEFVFAQLMKSTADCKVPKTISEVLEWMGEAIEEFGPARVDLKSLIAYVKDSFEKQHPAIKTSGIKTLVSLRRTYGPGLRDMLHDVKPQLLSTIDEHFARVQEIPGGFQPSRHPRKDSGSSVPPNISRTDISSQISTALLNDSSAADWKTRQMALTKVEQIVAANSRISPKVGQLMVALKARLGDSNKNLIVQALGLIAGLSEAMGQGVKHHLKVLGSPVLHCLADNKATVRQAAAGALSALAAAAGFDSLVAFLPKSFDCLAARPDLTQWIATTLSLKDCTLVPNSLLLLVKPVLACLQDKNADTRKHTELILAHVVRNVGYEAVAKETRDMKPAVAKTINEFLDRHRGSVMFTPRESSRLIAEQDKENDSSRINMVTTLESKMVKPPGESGAVEMAAFGFVAPLSDRTTNQQIAQPPEHPASALEALPEMSPPTASQDVNMVDTDPVQNQPVCAATKGEATGSVPMEVEGSAQRPDLQLDAAFAPTSGRRSTSQLQSAPARVAIPVTETRHEAVSRTEHCRARENRPSSPEQCASLLDRIHTGNNAQCIDALKMLADSYINPVDDAEAADVNHILEVLMHRISIAFETEPLHVREAKFLLSTLQALLNKPALAAKVSYDLIYYTVGVVLERLQDDKVRRLQDAPLLLKSFNTVVLKILQHCDHTVAFQCLLARLHDYFTRWKGHASDENHQLMSLVVKCLLKLTQFIPEAIDRVDLRAILKSIDAFLVKNPPTVFKGGEDMPLRTIKTILNEVVKAKGPPIKQHLDIESTSLIVNFIDVCLQRNGYPIAEPPRPAARGVQPAVQSQPQAFDPSRPCTTHEAPVPRGLSTASAAGDPSGNGCAPPQESEAQGDAMVARLDQVFLRIRNKEATNDGIQELHHIITEDPELNLEPWLSKCSAPFQSYIKRQLQKIQSQSQGAQGSAARVPHTAATLDSIRARLNAVGPLPSPGPMEPTAGAAVPPASAAAIPASVDVTSTHASTLASIRQRMHALVPQ